MHDPQVEMIVFNAKELGCTTKVQQSDSSASIFIEIAAKQQSSKLNNPAKTCVIRLSDKPLPEDFSVLIDFIDYEVGTHREANGSWFDCVIWLTKKLQLPMPVMIERLQKRQLEESEKQMENKLYDLADDQYNYVLNKALDKCKKSNSLLYETYHELKELVLKFSGPEKAQQAIHSKLNAAIREILRRYG